MVLVVGGKDEEEGLGAEIYSHTNNDDVVGLGVRSGSKRERCDCEHAKNLQNDLRAP